MDSTPTGRAVLGKRKPVLSLASGAAAALATTTDSNPLAALQQLCRSVPVVDIVNLLAVTAAQCHASDVHIEPRHDHVAVRYRLDGLLTGITHLPKWMDAALTSRVKVLAGMDIADKRRPQDGRLAIKGESGDIVFRVSTLPTQYGEKVVMRLLHEHTVVPPLDSLGLSGVNLARLKGLLRHRHGMILVVGPTGSGKTTTLASALSSLQSGEMNIITLEDPIEYPLPNVNQTQINDKADLTFAAALRAALRQDPDVIMLGEIRDGETAKTADVGESDRASRALHPPHERRAIRGHTIDGHGRRVVHDLVDAARRRRPAAGPQAVPALPQAQHQLGSPAG